MADFKQTLVIDHSDGAVFEGGGLRDQFVYRHFGIEEATDGKYSAHVIRGGPGKPPIENHIHTEIDFLMVYVLKGWVTFWYEGRGEETLKAGSVHLLPPEIKHGVVAWSDDIEMLEITSPADYGTREVTAEELAETA